MFDADPRSQPLRLLSSLLAQRKCNLLKLSGGVGRCGGTSGSRGSGDDREQEEKGELASVSPDGRRRGTLRMLERGGCT